MITEIKTVQKIIRRVCLQNSLSLEMFAEIAEVSVVNVGRWARGEAYPRFDSLVKIQRAFKVHPADFFGG